MIDLDRIRAESDARCLARTVLTEAEKRRQWKRAELERRRASRQTNRPTESERLEARLQVPLPKALLEALHAEAQRQKRSASWVVRRAIEAVISKQEGA